MTGLMLLKNYAAMTGLMLPINCCHDRTYASEQNAAMTGLMLLKNYAAMTGLMLPN